MELGYGKTECSNLIKLALASEALSEESFSDISKNLTSSDEIQSDWKCSAVTLCLTLTDFNSSIDWIAKKLSLPFEDVEKILNFLESIKVIDRGNSPWKINFEMINEQDKKSVIYQNYLLSNLEKSLNYFKKKKHLNIETEEIDIFTGSTISLDKNKIHKLSTSWKNLKRTFLFS